MKFDEIRVPASSVIGSLHCDVRLTGLMVARWRLWLGGKIIGLGIWIAGCSGSVSIERDENDAGC